MQAKKAFFWCLVMNTSFLHLIFKSFFIHFHHLLSEVLMVKNPLPYDQQKCHEFQKF